MEGNGVEKKSLVRMPEEMRPLEDRHRQNRNLKKGF
jgi:hypothetical protein